MVDQPGTNNHLSVRNSTFVLDTVGTGDPLFYDLSKYLLEHGAKKVILFRHPFEENKRMGVHLREVITVDTRIKTEYLRPNLEPWSYPLNLTIPLGATEEISCWFGFNNLSTLRGVFYGRKKIRKVCSWYIDFVPERFGKKTIPTIVYEKLDRYLDKKIDVRVELTQNTANLRAQNTGLTEAPVVIAPIGQWIDKHHNRNVERFRNQDIAYLGGLNERLGGEVLVAYLQACLKLGWTGNAYVIGSGPLLDLIRKQVQERRLELRINILGYVEDRMTVEKILGQCAIGVAPYKPDEHNFSATTDSAKLKSYASSGLPIVMTGVPVNSIELQTSQVASICKYDVQDLASTTMTILNHQETWSRMNSAAIEYIAKYDWNHIFAKVMSNLGYVDVE